MAGPETVPQRSGLSFSFPGVSEPALQTLPVKRGAHQDHNELEMQYTGRQGVQNQQAEGTSLWSRPALLLICQVTLEGSGSFFLA